MAAEEEKENVEARCRDMWKAFGLESALGKKLFRLYNKGTGEPPRVVYPPVRTRPRAVSLKPAKPCPQTTRIEYPAPRPKPGSQPQPAILLVPRRKPREAILEEARRAKEQPGFVPVPGRDRQRMVTELQRRLRGLDDAVEPRFRAQALQAFGHKLAVLEQRLKTPQPVQSDPFAALGELFEQLAGEVAANQRQLEELQRDGLVVLAEKKKASMAEKVADLQRIVRMMGRAEAPGRGAAVTPPPR